MKNIILKLTIVLLSLCFSQTIIAQKRTEGEYVKNDWLDKFVGTWEWQNGSEVFRIVLSKQKLATYDWYGYQVNYYRDVLVGWHFYRNNSGLVESTMDKSGMIFTEVVGAIKNSSIYGGASRSPEYARFTVKDITKNKKGEGRIEMLPGKTDEARWTLKNPEGVHVITPDSPMPPPGFTLPTDVIMRKVPDVI